MAAFEYTALDAAGSQQKGTEEADSARQVRQILRDRGWTPLDVSDVSGAREKRGNSLEAESGAGRGLSATQLAMVTRQLATLIQAAMPVEEALLAVAEQQEQRRLRNVMLAVRTRVLEGCTLAQGMNAFPAHFPRMYRATVDAGEQAGFLDKVLLRLADYTEQRMLSRQKVQMALLYPALLMLSSLVIVSFLLGYVVPDVIKVFIDSGQSLPLITRVLVGASDGFQSYWPWLLIGILGGGAALRYALRQPVIRVRWHRRLLSLFVIGRFSRSFNTSQFASTLSILTRSDVSLVDALTIASRVVSNDAFRDAVGVVARKVSEGISLHRALRDTHLFPPMMLHMIASGEAMGELDSMLERAARNQQTDLENRIAVLVGLFEPLMLVFMGGVVLLIVLAILLPILNMNTLIT